MLLMTTYTYTSTIAPHVIKKACVSVSVRMELAKEAGNGIATRDGRMLKAEWPEPELETTPLELKPTQTPYGTAYLVSRGHPMLFP